MKIDWARTRKRLHFASGIVLALFVLGHFSNHALGLISIDAMEAMRHVMLAIWRNRVGSILLYGALFLHFVLALDSLVRRQTLRMPVSEALRICAGLSLPFLLIGHVSAVRIEAMISGFQASYPQVLLSFWSRPDDAVMQAFALVVVWTHACLGFWFWMRAKKWYRRYALLLYSFALLLPVLSLLGFAGAARAVANAPPFVTGPTGVRSNPVLMETIRSNLYWFFAATIAGALIWRALPVNGRVRITYPGGRVVSVHVGFSVLEASRMAGIAHASVCGGKGRCSTCRIRIVHGAQGQPAPSPAERHTLSRIGAPDNIRLACQLRPEHDITVAPVLSTDSGSIKNTLTQSSAGGRERQIAVLFCDLRDFTMLAGKKLPFDTVYLLNRYFEMVGEAVENSGGVIDKFIGDGALALFGLNGSLQDACLQALTASAQLSEGIERLNRTFAVELDIPLRIAIGMHAGTAVVGEMGYGRATSLTAVGDTINTASRLESLAKQHDSELAVSLELINRSGLNITGHDKHEIAIRGREGTLETMIMRSARDLSIFLQPKAMS